VRTATIVSRLVLVGVASLIVAACGTKRPAEDALGLDWDGRVADPLAAYPDSADGAAGRVGDAALLAGKDALLYLAWTTSTGDSTDAWLSRSADLGEHFGAPVRINDVAGRVVIGEDGQERPEIAFGPGEDVVALWTDHRAGGADFDIRTSRSVDGGASFLPSVRVDDGPDSTTQALASLFVEESGRPWAVWLDTRDATPEEPYLSRVRVTCSPDGGRTFLPSVDATASQAHGVCPCCRPAVAARGNDVVVLFRNEAEGVRDIAVSRSRDGGATFEPTRSLADDGWRIDQCPTDGPAVILLPDGRWGAAWSTGAGGKRAVRFIEGSLADTSFASPAEFAAVLEGADQTHPVLVARGDFVVLAWEEAAGDVRRLAFATSRDAGRTFPAPLSVEPPEAAGLGPRVSLAGRRHLVFAWSDSEGGARMTRALLTADVMQKGAP
jgi:hypothetical protein